MNARRFVIAVFGILLVAVVTYIAYRFIAAITLGIFLYYSTRRFHKSLTRLRLPTRIRAVVTLSMVAVPLIALFTYTAVVIAFEVQTIIERYPVIEAASGYIDGVESADDVPDPTPDGLFMAYQAGDLDPVISIATSQADVITSLFTAFLLNVLIMIVIAYYLLIDGSRAHQWLLRFDDGTIVREYFEAADEELEAVLFGNLLNVIIISLVAVVVYMGYNALVPTAAEVPFPALAGALTGIASLIPVIGMKIVYVPLAAAAAAPLVMNGGDLDMLVYIGGFLLAVIILVDTIPDLFLRPYLSGKRTHVGLLMLAYIFGPIIFGFYGLFLAPIILVLGLTFADTALPRLLGVEPEDPLPPDQRTLDEF